MELLQNNLSNIRHLLFLKNSFILNRRILFFYFLNTPYEKTIPKKNFFYQKNKKYVVLILKNQHFFKIRRFKFFLTFMHRF